MKWICCISVLVLVPFISVGQARFDANWCFGYGAGIDFSDTANIRTFRQGGRLNEACASFSDSSGNLQFHLNPGYTFPSQDPMNLVDAVGNLLPNGDSINVGTSVTNGALILPRSDSLCALFHIGYYDQFSCTSDWCYKLMLTEISKVGGGWAVARKNVNLGISDIEEKMAAVRHANGRDWWLYLHAEPRDLGPPCTDTFYRYLVTENSITGPFVQKVGRASCARYAFFGEMVFSEDGTKLARALAGDSVVEIYGVDRCTGELELSTTIHSMCAYSLAFSPSDRYLYTVGNGTSIEPYGAHVFQYDLWSPSVESTKLRVFSNPYPRLGIGQMQLAPDKRILYYRSERCRPDSGQQSQRNPFARPARGRLRFPVLQLPFGG